MTAADSAQRLAALDPLRSFAVSAPAGSGKTELLIQRVLRLLALVDEPEEILCMTFTRKAAGEMQHRVVEALVRASNNEQPQSSHQKTTLNLAREALAQDQARGWRLLENPNRLRIQTIDGFCLNLAQQLAVESSFGDYSEPLDDPTPYYREVIAELLLPSLEQQKPLGKAITTLLRHLDNDLNKLELLLINLLSKREQWLGQLFQSRGARDYLEGFLNDVIEETLSEAQHLLAPYGSDLALLADYAASQLPYDKRTSPINHCLGMAELPENNLHFIEQWQGLCELLLTKGNDWRKAFNKNIGFPTETDAGDKAFAKAQKEAVSALIAQLRSTSGLQEALEDIRFLPPLNYNNNQWHVLEALTLLLPALAAQLSLIFQQQKVCDFTEITLAALRALGLEDEPTDLALKLDYQVKHILTDEFQDTSSVQFTILRRLTAGWEPNDGRSLFIVGDAMQSLYGFRNANVGLFLEARSLPIGNIQLEPLDLQVNFRSQAGIIDWVNQAFVEVFPTRDNISRGAVSYSTALAHHPSLPTEAVTVDAFINDPQANTNDKIRLAEATQVVKRVEESKLHDPDGSIAILVRNRTHLPDILNALQQAGHRWQATDINPLGKRMPVVDLMSLTRALLSPADRIAWLSILRSPCCGLDLHDLFQIANTTLPEQNPVAEGERYPLLFLNILNHHHIPSLSPEGRQILGRISSILKIGWDQRYRKPLRIWIEGIWEALGGKAALVSISELEQCQQYLDLLEQQETGGTISDWPAFEKAVQSLYAKPDQEADPNLHVMTIHKAKGLEFDTVIIPGLNRKPRGDDKQLMLWQERVSKQGENQLIIGPLEQAGQDSDPLFKYLQREHQLKNQLEKARVLYVGTTRAIKKLHLMYTTDNELKPTANSLLESLWPVLESAIEAKAPGIHCHYQQPGEGEGAEMTNEPTPTLDHLQRLPTDWQHPKIITVKDDAPIAIEQAPQDHDQSPLTEQNPTARHTGTVLHRILRQIVVEGFNTWNLDTINNRKPFWNIQLRQLGVNQTGEAVGLMCRAITNCLQSDTAQWILSKQHAESQCEYAIGYISQGGKPKTAVLDRTFVADGIRWIIDYKMAEPAENESQQEFLSHQVQQYRAQLEHYAALFSPMDDTPIKIALYFPLINQLEII
jgi:ATP-dependent helicase/nuclease subunit A